MFARRIARTIAPQLLSQISRKARENGTFTAFSWASDESPPGSAKYAGLRFQVTWIYVIFFLDVALWDSPEYEFEMPIIRREYLCDVVNCPGKTGDVVFDRVSKQWSRFGVSSEECCAGVGDGGGENEGCSGVHAHIESRQPSYVRRRCLLHLPWRVADQGLIEMGALHEETKAISTYIHDSSTWQRFKVIATKPIASGGLNLFREGSSAYADFFRDLHQQISKIDQPLHVICCSG